MSGQYRREVFIFPEELILVQDQSGTANHFIPLVPLISSDLAVLDV